MKYIDIIVKKVQQLFKGGFFHIFIGSILVKLIAFFSSIVIVRMVDKSAYAYLAYADNLYNYALAFAGLGMPSAICKYCAVAKSKDEDRAYLEFALKYGTIFQILTSCIVVLYVNYFDIAFPEAKGIIYVLFFYPIVSNILSTLMGYVRAHENNKLYSKMAVIQTLFIFVGSVVFVNLWGIMGIAGARYIAIIIACGAAFKFIRQEIEGSRETKLLKKQKIDFLAMSVSLMVANLFTLIIPMNEMTLVSELLRSEIMTANYKVATMIPSQLVFITQSIVIYYFTIIAKMSDKKQIWKLSKKVGVVTVGIVMAVCLVGILSSPLIIRSVYGNQYADAIRLSSIFWVVYGINASIRVLPMNFLPAIGVAKFNAVVSIITCGVHIVLTYCFISTWGVWGAGISAAIVYSVSAIAYWWYLRKQCLVVER